MYNASLVKARSEAFKLYRRDGMIHSRSWSIEDKLQKWYKLIETWSAERDKERLKCERTQSMVQVPTHPPSTGEGCRAIKHTQQIARHGRKRT